MRYVSKSGFQLMADGRSSALGVSAQTHVELVLLQDRESAPTQRLATVVENARAITQKLQNATRRNVQVNFSRPSHGS